MDKWENQLFKAKIVRGLQKGFSLPEMLIYIAVLLLVLLAVASFLVWSIRSNSKAHAMREVADSSQRVLGVIASEIQKADSIYSPTTVFSSDSGQLSLETTDYLPIGEDITYIDFYICSDRICMKKESQDPVAITSEKVKINKLMFSQIATTSIQINLETEFDDQTGRPENQAMFSATTTAVLRNY